MKIVIAPDSYKGSLTAKEVAHWMTVGLKRALPDASYQDTPVADGGDGTMAVLVDATGGHVIHADCHDPLGNPITAQYGILGDGQTGVIEMAAASGLQFIAEQTAQPLSASTYGTGELIKAALEHGLKKILLCLGGSATSDGGIGMAQALGIQFKNQQNSLVGHGNTAAGEVARIDCSTLDPRVRETTFILVSDVTNPLTGHTGASFTFGQQKGANHAQQAMMDRNLHHFAHIVKKQLHRDFEMVSGAGAAGGLGFASMVFLGAKMQPGITVVLNQINFEQSVEDADFIVTGEGGTDEQTKYGKAPYGVARAAKAIKPDCIVICLSGNVAASSRSLYDQIDVCLATVTGAKPLAAAIHSSRQDIAQTAENVGRLIACLRPSSEA